MLLLVLGTSFPLPLLGAFLVRIFFFFLFLGSRERFLFLADSADVFSTVWFLTSFPIVLFADFTDVFCTEWFLVAHAGFAEVI